LGSWILVGITQLVRCHSPMTACKKTDSSMFW
jgi:hypothetical protein